MSSYTYSNTGQAGGSSIGSQNVANNHGHMELNVNLDINQLEDFTEKEIKTLTEKTIHVAALDEVLEKLDKGVNWVTIVGHPGEGKTTLGYMVLKHIQQSGTRVFRVDTPTNFEKLLGIDDCLIMLNDTFGSFTFDPTKLAEWQQLLFRVIDLHSSTSEGSKVARVLFISRWNVLNVAKSQLERFSEKILDTSRVVNLSGRTNVQEKMNMLNYHLERANKQISQEMKTKVVETDTPHGFPHCCQIYADFRENYDIVEFFSHPLEFLDQTTKVLVDKKNYFALFKEMIAQNGELDTLGIDDDESKEHLKVVSDGLIGSYLVHINRYRVTFSHAAIYESVAQAVARKNITFFLKSASLSFLRQKLNIVDEGQTDIRGFINVDAHERLIDILVNRFSKHMLDTNEFGVFGCQISENFQFCKSLIERTFHPSSDSTPVPDRQSLSVNQLDKFGQTILHYSVLTDNITLVVFLLNMCADVNVPKGYTPLHYVLVRANPNVDIVKLLLEYKADVNIQYEKSTTPLHLRWFLENLDVEIEKLLLEYEPGVNLQNENGLTPLHRVCSQAKPKFEIVKLLLEYKADVNIQITHGYTPLHLLCVRDNPDVEVVKLLLKHKHGKANVNLQYKSGRTPLHLLWIRDNPDVEVVKLLLEYKANVNLQDKYGVTLLYRVCSKDKPDVEIVKMLLEYKADVNLQNENALKLTPLLFLCSKDKPDVEIVKMLLEYKADVNLQNENGMIPLHCLCRKDKPDVELVKMLLEYKADVNLQDKYGGPPLHIMCMKDNPDVELVKMLLEYSKWYTADVNLRVENGLTPLLFLCFKDNPDVELVKMLLENKADVNLQDEYGLTPLHRVCSKAKPKVEIVKLLLEYKADVNIQMRHGMTPLDCVRLFSHPNDDEILKLLEEQGAKRQKLE